MSRRARDGGYTLIVVLTMTALLATLLGAVVAVSRPSIGLARLGADEARADALLDAGVTAAGYLLFVGQREPGALPDLTLPSGTVAITAVDEGARVDLNGASPDLLQALFRAVGARSLTPQAFASRVADWRDEDGDRSEDGAEDGDYFAANLGYAPANAPFQSPEELEFILGLSAADVALLLPAVTVFSPSGRLDVLSAPAAILRAIPGIGRGDVEAILQKRRGAKRDDAELAAMIEPYAEFLSIQPSDSYSVSLQAKLANGYAKRAEAVIVVSPDGTTPYVVLRFSSGI